ncbi:radical SAM protein [Planctomycetales bacterium ZRK34]|nr:radical SAM protein [Planctomycetales bacterium ZRK34]
MTATPPKSLQQLYAAHPRQWREFDYVYPVFSRRSGGLSIGVNLNPDKVCNWDCVYCQVDRSVAPKRRDVDLNQLREELDWMLGFVAGGAIWEQEPFANVPEPQRRVNDIAFSGDGEPTAFAGFEDACRIAIELKAAHNLGAVKIIVLTNMTLAHREYVQRAFALLDKTHSEIWAKLEAGTQAYYEQVDRSAVKLDRVLANILTTGKLRPVVIQSMWMRLHDQLPPEAEFDAFADRLKSLRKDGCQIKQVQLYTIARHTAEAYATPLSDDELDQLSDHLKDRLPDLRVDTFYGVH